MVRNVHTVSPDMTVEQVRQEIINSNFHGFPIVEKGYLLGFVTAKELLPPPRSFCVTSTSPTPRSARS